MVSFFLLAFVFHLIVNLESIHVFTTSTQSHGFSSENDLVYVRPANSHHHDGSVLNAILKPPPFSSARESIAASIETKIHSVIVDTSQKQPAQQFYQDSIQGQATDSKNRKRKSSGKIELPPSTRARLRLAWTEERKKKQSEKTRAQFLGKPRSKESNQKISESLKGRKMSQIAREKMRKAQTGSIKSEATRQKMRKAQLLIQEKKRQERFANQQSAT